MGGAAWLKRGNDGNGRMNSEEEVREGKRRERGVREGKGREGK